MVKSFEEIYRLSHLREMAKVNQGNKDIFGYNLYVNFEITNHNYAHIHAMKGDKSEIVYDFKGNLINGGNSANKQTIENISRWIRDNHRLIINVWRKDVLAQNPSARR